jgi:hypothetical protein
VTTARLKERLARGQADPSSSARREAGGRTLSLRRFTQGRRDDNAG